jgi:hypothetical protein
MQFARPIFAPHPRRFGRAPARQADTSASGRGVADDLALFATTFLAGFVFVSILIG